MKYKKHIFTLLLLVYMIITLVTGIIGFNNYVNNSRIMNENEISKCKQLNESYTSDRQKEYCEKLFNTDLNPETDYFYLLSNLDSYTPLSSNLILILLIILSSCYYVSKYLKNNIVTYDLTRENYKKIKHKLLINAYIPALAITIFTIIKLIIFYLITNNFNYSEGLGWNLSNLANPLLFLLVYVLIVLFDALIYSNISLIVTRKIHNFIITSILSYLVVFGIELFLEIVLSAIICTSLFNSDIGIVFNIINFGNFNDSYGLLLPLIVQVVIYIITSIIVYISYKNKENLVIDCEAN